MAEAVRFELTIQLPVCLLSRQMPSSTRPRFHNRLRHEMLLFNGLIDGLGTLIGLHDTTTGCCSFLSFGPLSCQGATQFRCCLLWLCHVISYLKNFLTIHRSQKYRTERGKTSSVQLNGSGTSRGTLPYARSKVSFGVILPWPSSLLN